MSGRGGFKKAGYAKRGGGGGASKPAYTKKRTSPNDEETVTRKTKKAKKDIDEDEGEEGEAFVPTLMEDDDGNAFVPLKANTLRRVTISEFKGATFVNIREHWKNDDDKVLPGKKGISLSVEQYNALLAAAPLIESVLEKQGEKVVRPDYEGAQETKEKDEMEEEEQEEEEEDEGVKHEGAEDEEDDEDE